MFRNPLKMDTYHQGFELYIEIMENTQIKQIQYPHIVGIDISKMSIDVALIDTKSQKTITALFSNDSEGFLALAKFKSQSPIYQINSNRIYHNIDSN